MKNFILKLLVIVLIAQSFTGLALAQTQSKLQKKKAKTYSSEEIDKLNEELAAKYSELSEEEISELNAREFTPDQEEKEALDSILLAPIGELNEDGTSSGIKNIENIDSKIVKDAKFTQQIYNSGKWGIRVVYIPKIGDPMTLTSYRSNEQIKPASTLKIFSGYLAFLNKTYPIPSLSLMLHKSVNPMAEAALESVIPAKMEIQNNGFNERKHLAIEKFKVTFNGLTDLGKLHMVNGSGLNTSDQKDIAVLNKVTANMQTSFLYKILRSPQDYAIFKKLLAQPGQMGTLSHRLVATNSLAKIYAKTGTLDQTVSLAGFAETKNGVLIFSILGDELKLANMKSYLRSVQATQAKARELIDDLLYIHVKALVAANK